jgi:hypothetical protein
VDPLAEKHYDISPYVYCAGNPINLIDPDGMESQQPSEIINIEGPDKYVDENNRLISHRETQEIDNLLSKTKNNNKSGYITADANEKDKTKEVEPKKDNDPSWAELALLAIPSLPEVEYNLVNAAEEYGPEKGGQYIMAAAVLVGGLILIDQLPHIIIDQFAHTPKKQSTGKSGSDNHAAQYTHGGKNRPKNPNQKKGAEERKNKGKEVN